MSSSRGSSRARDQTCIFCASRTGRRVLLSLGWLGSTKVSLIKWEQGWWWCGGPGQTPLTYRHSVFPSPHHSLLSLSTANTKTRTPGPACYPKVNSTASPKLHPATGTSAVKRWHPPDAHNGNLGVEMQPCSPHPINLQVTPIH